MLDENRPSAVVNESNHAILVSSHVEDRQIADEVRRIKGPPHIGRSFPFHTLNRICPMQQRLQRIRVPPREIPNRPPAVKPLLTAPALQCRRARYIPGRDACIPSLSMQSQSSQLQRVKHVRIA